VQNITSIFDTSALTRFGYEAEQHTGNLELPPSAAMLTVSTQTFRLK